MRQEIQLSKLTPGKNPRKVKPGRESHKRLVASIRAFGLLQPLVVRPLDGKREEYEVVAGHRRFFALKEVHNGSKADPKIPCVIRNVEAVAAEALSLAENFQREAMHPQDEAEAFARLASADGKQARDIASEFGVTEHYVRQRMKLAMLAGPVKAAYREASIDTSIAEAFCAVPEDRQLEVWKEVNGNPRHADHVRNIIAHAWIDAKLALFDPASVPPSVVSMDLFSGQVLIERQAFMEAQSNAVLAQREAMTEDGWSEVVIGKREDVQDRLLSMAPVEREFDEQTTRKLAKIAARQEKLQEAAENVDQSDEKRWNRLQNRFAELEADEREVLENAPEYVSEETKARATAFLMLGPDGRLHREYRLPRQKARSSSDGDGHSDTAIGSEPEKAPTSDDLSDKQLSVTFTHQALAVREALLKNAGVRMRLLALILHDKVRSDALVIRHDVNGTTLYASQDGFGSAVFERLKEKRNKLDPLADKPRLSDCAAFGCLAALSDGKVDPLIDLLVVECISAHPVRRTNLVHELAELLKVNVREHWRPDAAWLSSFQKIQLGHLLGELRGPMHAPGPERKKSELVDTLAKFFEDAAEGKLDDKPLAEKLNGWLPSNLRSATPVANRESQ